MDQISINTYGPSETEQLGARLAKMLVPGDTIALSGELGAGKTCFVRGLVSALSAAQGEMVASPTYAIMNEYAGDVPVYHIDCYRLRDENDAVELGFEDLFTGSGITLVEWPERIAALLPSEKITIRFENHGNDSRCIILIPEGLRYVKILEQVAVK